ITTPGATIPTCCVSPHETLNDADSLGRLRWPPNPHASLSAIWHLYTHLPHDGGGCETEWMDSLPADHRGALVWAWQEVLPIPGEDGKCDLVPVIGEAWCGLS